MPAKRKLDDLARARAIRALEKGADMATAARLVGVTRQTLWNEAQRNPAFKVAMEDAAAIANGIVVSALFARARDGDVQAARYWLSCRDKDWRPKKETALTNGDGSPLVPPRIEVVYVDAADGSADDATDDAGRA